MTNVMAKTFIRSNEALRAGGGIYLVHKFLKC